MTLFSRSSTALEEVEAALAAASAAGGAPDKAATDGAARALAELAPAVAKLKANALESDPDKAIYAPAMRDKCLALAARFEAAQEALAPLKVRWMTRREATRHVGEP
jgi:hypothetical protein